MQLWRSGLCISSHSWVAFPLGDCFWRKWTVQTWIISCCFDWNPRWWWCFFCDADDCVKMWWRCLSVNRWWPFWPWCLSVVNSLVLAFLFSFTGWMPSGLHCKVDLPLPVIWLLDHLEELLCSLLRVALANRLLIVSVRWFHAAIGLIQT